MFSEPHRNNGGTERNFNKQTLLYSSLSTLPSAYYPIVIYGDSSIPGIDPYLNSFKQLGGRPQVLPTPLFLKNNQPKVIHMPKKYKGGKFCSSAFDIVDDTLQK